MQRRSLALGLGCLLLFLLGCTGGSSTVSSSYGVSTGPIVGSVYGIVGGVAGHTPLSDVMVTAELQGAPGAYRTTYTVAHRQTDSDSNRDLYLNASSYAHTAANGHINAQRHTYSVSRGSAKRTSHLWRARRAVRKVVHSVPGRTPSVVGSNAGYVVVVCRPLE